MWRKINGHVWSILLIAFIAANVEKANAQAPEPCPPDTKTGKKQLHAHVARRWSESIPGAPPGHPVRINHIACACDTDYKYNKQYDLCLFDETQRPATRAQCIEKRGMILGAELKRCESPLKACLKTDSTKEEAAKCVMGHLLAGLAFAVSPEPVTKPVAMAAFGGALANCGFNAIDAAKACDSTWGTCAEPYLQEWKDRIASCPAK